MDAQQTSGTDGAVVKGRFPDRVRPKTALIVEISDGYGTVISRERHEVVRPPGPVRQHEQLVRMVTGQLPEAHVVSAGKGLVRLTCRGHVVVSAYEDALVPASETRQPLR